MQFKPQLEQLEGRNVPAIMLHVTAAQQAQVIAIAEGQAHADENIQLPPAAGDSIAIVVEIHGQDGDLWDGPVKALNSPTFDEGTVGPQSENALVWLYKVMDTVHEDGTTEDHWYVGAIVWGCGANQQAYSMYANDFGVGHFVVLSLTPTDDGKLGISQQLVSALQTAQLGDQFEGPGSLLDGMASDPKGLAKHDIFTDLDGNITGELYTLKLALPTAGGGFQVFTLTHDPATTWDGQQWLPELWTLTKVETLGSLPTDAYHVKVI